MSLLPSVLLAASCVACRCTLARCPTCRDSPELGRMLSQLQLGGKQVFLLTNSLYDYTDTVMTFLLGAEWIDYFDLVICGARKPGFLLDPYLPLFQVGTGNQAAVARFFRLREVAPCVQRPSGLDSRPPHGQRDWTHK